MADKLEMWVIHDSDTPFGVFESAADAKKAYARECQDGGDPVPKWRKYSSTTWLAEDKATLSGRVFEVWITKFTVGELS